MFQEEIAKLTAKHLMTHIRAYLDEIQTIYGDSIKLQTPKAIETSNLVGGVYNTTTDRMPAYAIDVLDKQPGSIIPENYLAFVYSGHIAGVVAGGSEDAVNKTVKRHEQAVESFVKRHRFLHQQAAEFTGNDFRVMELIFNGMALSGAELADEDGKRQIWIAGFRNDLIWVTSESEFYQHA